MARPAGPLRARRSPSARSPPRRDAWHHGDLRRALLDAARATLREGGDRAASLREVARRAGVSVAAPYHHFASREALLDEVAALGFAEMDRTMADAQAAAPDHPAAQLVAVGMGYLRYARREPAVFQLMMRPRRLARASASLAPGGPYTRLLSAVARLRGEPPPVACVPDPDAHLCWATVHGLALLEPDDAAEGRPSREHDAYARALLERLVGQLAGPGGTRPAAAAG